MLGAIIGDIAGSRFEWNNHRSKDFTLFHEESFFTDDTVMTLAVWFGLTQLQKEGLLWGPNGIFEKERVIADDPTSAAWNILEEGMVRALRTVGRPYDECGYGGRFIDWMYTSDPAPYNSFGNGAAMRVSACGWMGKSLAQVKVLSRLVTGITHNHPEGLKAAEATSVAIYMARNGATMQELHQAMSAYYDLNFTLDEIRPTYKFTESSQGTMPVALVAFFESVDFEDAVRNAISVGGDSDTIGAIAGSIAEAYYTVPKELGKRALEYLDESLKSLYDHCMQEADFV